MTSAFSELMAKIESEGGEVKPIAPQLPPTGGPAAGPPSETLTFEGGNARILPTKAFCGNGIIEGDEHCDGNNLRHHKCRELGAEAGNISCTKSCEMDISDCVTPRNADSFFSGRAERCDCNCAERCDCNCGGGATNAAGVCTCRCKERCQCNCEQYYEADLQDVQFDCLCVCDSAGQAECTCSLTEFDISCIVKPTSAGISKFL